MATISSDRIDKKFASLASSGRKALVCYATAGHPDFERSIDLLQGLEDAGADIVEVGVPFSDPIADGPVIQASSQRALDQGMNLDRVFDLVARASLGIPVVLFTYLNPLLSAGADVLSRCRLAGCDGILVTDLPVGADADRESWLGSSGLAFIRLVAPTTPDERMRQVALNGSGFVYLISRLGVTGARADPRPDIDLIASRLRAVTALPICVGFGISSPAQAKAVAGAADGVVVGSAIVRTADSDIGQAISLVRSLRAALDS